MFNKSPLSSANLKPSRLRNLMWLFFIAMALPTAVLVYKSYDQLKWEAFYQHRQLAEELSNRLDNKFNEFVELEEQRSFSDYNFVVVEGNNQASYLERSPLSTFPVANNTPGVIGYFQIDAKGVFTTPLLPSSPLLITRYGLNGAELERRRSAQAQIEEILSSNQLVETRESPALSADLEEEVFSDSAKGSVNSSLGSVANDIAGSRTSSIEQRVESYSSESITAADSAPAVIATSAPSAVAQNQAAFDRLSQTKQNTRGQTQKTLDKDSVLSQLEELESGSPYKKKVDQRQDELDRKRKESEKPLAKAEQALPAKINKRASRKTSMERALADDDQGIPLESNEVVALDNVVASDIKIFESEIDPFEVSLLESEHFVLYRKVWRNGQRYIQGLLVEQAPFINGLVRDTYSTSLLASMSSLTVIYQGNALASFSNNSSVYPRRISSQLSGSLLYRTRLSEPFNQLENVFTIRRLPAGPGGQVILWAAFIMGLVLSLGTFMLYRMSLRNMQLVSQQQDFVSAVSHELKTPLTSIRMYGEILQQGWADEDKKKGYYSYIFDESERLTRLINNVLELARMTRNETRLSLKTISVAELIDVIHSKVDSQIERAHFKLNLEVDDNAAPSKLTVDPDIFAQIVINLVDNAIKFSKDADHKVIDISASQQTNGKICFSVRDYGPGIAKDQLKKIFELFYRSENELTRQTTGTGIGLALVSQLTQLMNGEIDVVNQDPGAEFRLYF